MKFYKFTNDFGGKEISKSEMSKLHSTIKRHRLKKEELFVVKRSFVFSDVAADFVSQASDCWLELAEYSVAAVEGSVDSGEDYCSVRLHFVESSAKVLVAES